MGEYDWAADVCIYRRFLARWMDLIRRNGPVVDLDQMHRFADLTDLMLALHPDPATAELPPAWPLPMEVK
jgi:hypothetical protein